MASFVSVIALDDININEKIDDTILPDTIACDPDLGCFLYSEIGEFTQTVFRYSQKDPNFNVYMYKDNGAICTDPELPLDLTRFKIYGFGCAVTSEAMIINKFRGYTSGVITPLDTNVDVEGSCSYNSGHFVAAYSSYLTGSNLINSFTNNFNYIVENFAAKIDSSNLEIIWVRKGGNNTFSGHFVVGYGYTYRDDIYEYGTVRVPLDILIKNPSSTTLVTLSSLMTGIYPYVSRIDKYTKK